MTRDVCGIAMYLRDEKSRQGKLVQARCKTWACKPCSLLNVALIKKRADYGVRLLGGQWYLATLTVSAKTRGYAQSKAIWQERYGKLYDRMLKVIKENDLVPQGQKFHFIKVYEQHSEGTLHVHLFCNVDLQSWGYDVKTTDKRKANRRYEFREHKVTRKDDKVYYRSDWLADTCASLGLGHIHDWRPVGDSVDATMSIVGYITKYISKQIADDTIKWGTYEHRIEFSAGFPKLPEREKQGDWLPMIRYENQSIFLADVKAFWDIETTDKARAILEINAIQSGFWTLARIVGQNQTTKSFATGLRETLGIEMSKV